MIHPDIHPKADQIKVVKATIDELYATLKRYEESARGHYRLAMENLISMGEDHKNVHVTMRAIAENMTNLKSLIDSPDI